jgi:phosphoribosylaminoimidazole-succinocarboxamide synthase
MDNNFMGKEGQTVPEMDDAWIETISGRYIELYEKVTGETFSPKVLDAEETEKRIVDSLRKLGAI